MSFVWEWTTFYSSLQLPCFQNLDSTLVTKCVLNQTQSHVVCFHLDFYGCWIISFNYYIPKCLFYNQFSSLNLLSGFLIGTFLLAFLPHYIFLVLLKLWLCHLCLILITLSLVLFFASFFLHSLSLYFSSMVSSSLRASTHFYVGSFSFLNLIPSYFFAQNKHNKTKPFSDL